jgi:hypothetical protein
MPAKISADVIRAVSIAKSCRNDAPINVYNDLKDEYGLPELCPEELEQRWKHILYLYNIGSLASKLERGVKNTLSCLKATE